MPGFKVKQPQSALDQTPVRRFPSALRTYLHSKSIDHIDQWLKRRRDYVRNPKFLHFQQVARICNPLISLATPISRVPNNTRIFIYLHRNSRAEPRRFSLTCG